MSDAGRWDRARRILCVRLDAMGDVLMTTPALRALKGSGRHLTLLTSPSGAAAAALVPEVDDVIVHEAPWLKATPHRADARPESAMIERLREGRFDAAVIFTVFSQNPLPSALLCWMAEIPSRLAHCRENPYQLLTDWVARDRARPHRAATRSAASSTWSRPSAAQVDDERLSLRIPDQAMPAARPTGHLRATWGLTRTRPWVPDPSRAPRPRPAAIPAGGVRRGRAPARRWMHGHQVVWTGSEGERDLIEGIRAAMGVPSASLAGRLDLGGLAALIERAPALVSNNTGPVHVAAAVGTPVVVLYALTNTQHTPWSVPRRVLNHDVPCGPCYKSVCPEGHHDCLRKVAPAAVARAVVDLVGGPVRRPSPPILANRRA